ncbi:MAG: cytidine deaminase [Clostridia bacterium]|nr:cytidine deaminase [Clostridia bacterium]
MTDLIKKSEKDVTVPKPGIKLSAPRIRRLVAAAADVRKNSYSPYSNYKVGAALLASSGKIYAGANFENASFGAGTCAERTALGAALSAGEREFIAICVCGADGNITPCGICRQALMEFGDIVVICAAAPADEENGEGLIQDLRCFRLKGLLPEAFGPAALDKD